jgi:hypothetical protein
MRTVIATKEDEGRICIHCASAGIFRLQRDCPYQVRMVEMGNPQPAVLAD